MDLSLIFSIGKFNISLGIFSSLMFKNNISNSSVKSISVIITLKL